jgi:hypothetical protein
LDSEAEIDQSGFVEECLLFKDHAVDVDPVKKPNE